MSQCLSIVYRLVVALESSSTPLARTYPLIVEAVTKLVNSAKQCCKPGISDIYLAAARSATKYLLESTFALPQLAHILSPSREKRGMLPTGGDATQFSPRTDAAP
jgi:hypothetical protein